VLRHDLTHARQPNPRPLDVARVLGTVESVEDMRQVLRRDAHAPIRDRQNRPRSVRPLVPRQAYHDAFAFGAVFDGIGRQIADHALDALRVDIADHCRPVRELDTATRQVIWAGQRVALSAREYTLLHYLVHHVGQTLTREQLERTVWGDSAVGSNVVEVYIGYLRHKLDAPFGTPLIHTVRGAGYALRAPESP